MQVCCLRSKRGQQCVSARNKALAQFWCSLFIQHLSVRLEAIDFAAAVHLPSDKLEAHDLTLGLSVGPRRGDCRPNRRFILRDAIGEKGKEISTATLDPWDRCELDGCEEVILPHDHRGMRSPPCWRLATIASMFVAKRSPSLRTSARRGKDVGGIDQGGMARLH